MKIKLVIKIKITNTKSNRLASIRLIERFKHANLPPKSALKLCYNMLKKEGK